MALGGFHSGTVLNLCGLQAEFNESLPTTCKETESLPTGLPFSPRYGFSAAWLQPVFLKQILSCQKGEGRTFWLPWNSQQARFNYQKGTPGDVKLGFIEKPAHREIVHE